MTQDVDAYYRQMAINFQEAADKAKLDEVALENESRVLGVTGDQSRYRKAQSNSSESKPGKSIAPRRSCVSRRPPSGWKRISR